MRLTAHEIALIAIIIVILVTGALVRAYRHAQFPANQDGISLPGR